jgi:serine/threonine protein kinase
LNNNGRHPSRIGRYVVVELIGHGAISRVYRALDDTIGRHVAVRLGTAGDPRVHQQARLTGQVAHPNVVSVLDLGEDDGGPFAVMELIDGGPIDVAPPSTSLDRRLDVMLQICNGVQAAHDVGVVHGGIKPAHVLLQPDGGIKMIDFGGDGATFASPEQAAGDVPTERSDVFAAGAIFERLLAGDGVDVPDALARTVRKAIAPDPSRRHGSINHLRAEIDQVREGRHGDRQRVLIAALDRYRDIEGLLAQRRALGRRLGLPAVERECDATLAKLATGFPEFARSGFDVNAVGDLDPRRALEALAQLQLFHNDVAAEVSVLRTATGEAP